MVDVVTKPSQRKGGKKSKRTDKRPARSRYWLKRTLEERKVKAIMKAYGLTEVRARERWHAERKGRVPKGYVRIDPTGGKADTHNKKVA